MTVTVTLDGFVFRDFEVPEEIPFGGAQTMAKKQMLGGERQIDAMGPDEEPIEWSGRFRGADAVSRAKALDTKRRAGKALALTWGEFSYTVVIARFRANYQRGGLEIPYSLTLEVVDTPVASSGADADSTVRADSKTALAQGAKVGDSKLSGLLGKVDSAVSAVSDFARTTQSAINGVLAPIRDAQRQVQSLIGAAEDVMDQVATVGGILPNNPVARQVAGLERQVDSAARLSNLCDVGGTLGRMSANLGAISAGGAEIVAAGGDLYRIAAQAYGDATEWSTVARANGLTDPVVSGVKKLLVPPTASGADGLIEI